MHIHLDKPNQLPAIRLGFIIVAKGVNTDITKYYVIVKRATTYSALNLESFKLEFLDNESPEAILKHIAERYNILDVLSPSQTILSRKDGN